MIDRIHQDETLLLLTTKMAKAAGADLRRRNVLAVDTLRA